MIKLLLAIFIFAWQVISNIGFFIAYTLFYLKFPTKERMKEYRHYYVGVKRYKSFLHYFWNK